MQGGEPSRRGLALSGDELARWLRDVDPKQLAALVDAPAWEARPDELLQRAADQLSAGVLRIVLTEAGRFAGGAMEPGTPLADYDEASASLEPTYAIGIELVGENDEPIPFARYEIELPSGAVLRGVLDREGRADATALRAAGTCRVRFPDLDADAWEFVESTALT